MATRPITTEPLPLGEILTCLFLLPEKALARIVERSIEYLDARSGDCDLEDDDPAGGAIEDCGEVEDWRPEGITLLKPVYGIDQSAGPINERAAHRDFQKRLLDKSWAEHHRLQAERRARRVA